MINIVSRREKIKYIFPLIIGFVISLFYFKKSKSIVLVGGNLGKSYDDNSKYMYRLIINNKNYKTFWLQKNKKQLSQEIKKFVTIGSIKSYYLYFVADYVFFSHSVSTDICPIAARIPWRQPFRVYLSHGVEGFKKEAAHQTEKADFYPCTNKLEYRIKKGDWGLDRSKLKVTGIARYDGLKKSTNSIINNILYLPTWREWDYSLSLKEFEKSKTFLSIKELLNSKKLESFLNENNLKLIVRLHPFFDKYYVLLKKMKFSENILISQSSIGDLINNCDMLITDYSSISWDFLFSEKPVVFYQFDLTKYLARRGAYLSFPDQLFGKSAYTVDDLVSTLQTTFAKYDINKIREYKYKYFDYFDTNNSERIFVTAIMMKKENNCSYH